MLVQIGNTEKVGKIIELILSAFLRFLNVGRVAMFMIALY
ncbi:hypothetical protein RV14_GL001305 [Enterococcus ratti]|uniref:Uncharacterized protein n=1 Tax=Enterococcus ratti TaxID=150033 RepID=A0A1L8WQW9_9ENTE|nr:hypothetical protein RV14_GL001305 [Enterococcus ratti]